MEVRELTFRVKVFLHFFIKSDFAEYNDVLFLILVGALFQILEPSLKLFWIDLQMSDGRQPLTW